LWQSHIGLAPHVATADNAGLAQHVARLGEVKHVSWETLRKTARKEYLNEGGRIILKWVYKN
jgi:hypothetical protein